MEDETFPGLPRRTFLDTNILQFLQRYGENIYDNVEIDPDCRFLEDIESLRKIMFVCQRAGFEFALSENSLTEVHETGNPPYISWAFEMLDYWYGLLREYSERKTFTGEGERNFDRIESIESQLGFLSKKDKNLVLDAIILECDAFLTMDSRLYRNSENIFRFCRIKVVRPRDFWKLLSPYARLWV